MGWLGSDEGRFGMMEDCWKGKRKEKKRREIRRGLIYLTFRPLCSTHISRNSILIVSRSGTPNYQQSHFFLIRLIPPSSGRASGTFSAIDITLALQRCDEK